MGLEPYALLTHAGQGPETEHLKPPAVCEDGGRPVHEGMQSTKAADELVARTEIEVIGVAQNDGSPTGHQVAGTQGLDRGLRANRHKRWRIEAAVRRVEPSQTCLALGIGMEEFERQWRSAAPRCCARLLYRANDPRQLRYAVPRLARENTVGRAEARHDRLRTGH